MNNPPEVFELKKDSHKTNCIARIAELEVDEDKPYQVEIYTAKDLRTKKQNALYWKHMGEIKKAGSGDMHMELKRKFLHPIFMASTTKEGSKYQSNYAALCLIKQSGLEIDYDELFGKVLSTKDSTPKQMAEYIEAYWPYINGKGIYLRDPDNYRRGQ